MRCMRAILLITAIMLAAAPALAEPTILTGTVSHIRDGDTIEVGKVPVRLNGVSAPELKEPLGLQSKQFMIDLVLDRPVSCELSGEKTYDRLVGTCYRADQDIGAAVIKAGLALDCPRYSGGRYAQYEVDGARQRIKLPRYCR